MPTLNEYAAQVAQGLDLVFDHSSMERLKDRIIAARAKLLKQSIEKHGGNFHIIQTYNFDLLKVDPLKDCDYKIKCTILRSVNKIPKPLNLKGAAPFLYVGTMGGTKPFIFAKPYEIALHKEDPYKSNAIFYDYTDGYIFIYASQTLKKASTMNPFENPNQVLEYCNGECNNDDVEFLLPVDLGFDIVRFVIDEIRMKPETNTVPVDDKVKRAG